MFAFLLIFQPKSFFLPVEADGSIFKNLGQKKFTMSFFLEELRIIERKWFKNTR